MAKKYYDENGNEVKVKQKRGGCLKWLLYGFILMILLGACGALLDDGEEEDVTKEQNPEETVEKEEDSETVENDSEEESEPVENDIEDEEESEPAEEKTEDTDDDEEPEDEEDEEFHKNDDDVMIFDQYGEVSLSVNTLVSKFSVDMIDEIKKHKDEFTNGAVFRLAGPLVDEYGNETKKYVISVYYTQDTIDKINVDNWPLNISDGLYKTADGVIVHPALRDNKHAQTKVYEGEQPEEYTYSVDSEYEE